MWRKAAAGISVAALIGLAGCGGTTGPEADDSPSPTAPASSAASPSGSPAADAETIRVEVKDGKVIAGDGRHTVQQGANVVLEIVSDSADEVHVHGYDEKAVLKPGRPSRIGFAADVPGVFEVELHESGLLLCELQVQ
ncbi:MAG: hypothetical protein ACRDUA_25250 [Micromonosporaceae bacterium]